jgi:hypothetical protein
MFYSDENQIIRKNCNGLLEGVFYASHRKIRFSLQTQWRPFSRVLGGVLIMFGMALGDFDFMRIYVAWRQNAEM